MKELWFEKAKKVHSNKYDYSKVNYVNNKTKVCIICPKHGEFWQIPTNHLQGKGCLKCGREISSLKQSLSKDEFVKRAIKIHQNYYDYSKVDYKNCETKVMLICPKHREFFISPIKHLKGQGCFYCGREKTINNKLSNTNAFISKAKQIHNNFYDYRNVNYIKSSLKVKIICPIHGEFEQTPNKHLNGHGCPECGKKYTIEENKLFKLLQNSLSEYNIIREKSFPFLNGKRLDFYIENLNIAIEYQGIQHFQPIDFFGGKEKYLYQKQNDIFKFEKCKEHNIKLFYFTKEKRAPKDYLDTIYSNEDELITSILEYANNRRNT